jgi:hypothetical protein
LEDIYYGSNKLLKTLKIYRKMNANLKHEADEIIPISELSNGIIREFNYIQESKTLCVTITDGFVYTYFGVPEIVANELRNSKNPGFFYRKYIRRQYRRLFKTYDLDVMRST